MYVLQVVRGSEGFRAGGSARAAGESALIPSGPPNVATTLYHMIVVTEARYFRILNEERLCFLHATLWHPRAAS